MVISMCDIEIYMSRMRNWLWGHVTDKQTTFTLLNFRRV